MYISYVAIKNYRGIQSDKFDASIFTCAIGENNAGKSTILLAISLFFSGTALNKSDFYDSGQDIEIEVTFSGVTESDVLRLTLEHRDRITELIVDSKISFTRLYNVEGKSELLCKRLAPKEERFNKNVLSGMMKGKRGKDISESVISIFGDYREPLTGLTTQAGVFAKIDEIIAGLPEDQLEYKLTSLPTGIENSVKNFLPDPIYIAAVKDLKDDVKNKESTTFGKLLGILLKFIEHSEHFEKINESFSELHSLLNVIRRTEESQDKRIEKLQHIERQITGFLQENFPQSVIEIEIPKPELKHVFSNAKILIDDGVKDIIDTKGDGIKRAVTFALLRTYVEQHKEQKKELATAKELNEKAVDCVSEEETVNPTAKKIEADEQPYIFLFEEPELFLHPNAQRILFEALEKLTLESNQVFVTTHSPLFFSPHSTGTFIKVIKEYPQNSKPYGRFLTINLLSEIQAKDAFQIMCYENNTAAFFSNKVLLVEGDSDLIYIKEIARLLNPEWNFDSKNIPIISINGKANVKRFVEFYKYFQIKIYTLVDSDALIDGFEKFEVCETTTAQRSVLLQVIDEVAKQQNIEAVLSGDKIKELIKKYNWKQKYDRLKVLCGKIRCKEEILYDELAEIECLFSEEVISQRRQIFIDKAIDLPGKLDLLELLRSQSIFILSHGAIESYYPDGITGDDKPTKALNAIRFLKEQEECRIHLPTIIANEKEVCELELIFERVFA